VTAPFSPKISADLQSAVGLMNQRRFAEARPLLERAAQLAPTAVDARFLHGAALRALGEFAKAEAELRAALSLDPNRHDAALDLARVLVGMGRFEEALSASERAAAAARPNSALLAERARALQALDRMDEFVAVRERIAALEPGKLQAQHNLAAALGDAGFAERAEAAARRTLAMGGDAPETWLVLARALQSQSQFEDSEAAFLEALRRRPAYADALRDLTQLIWMKSGSLIEAAAPLDRAILAHPEATRLRAIRARLQEQAGDAQGAYALLKQGGLAGDAMLEITAAHLALAVDPQLALGHAMRAASLAPHEETVQRKLIDVLLAVGEFEAALAKAEDRLAQFPLDQGLIASVWTAWRGLGDPRARALYDYETLTAAETIDTPRGWNTLQNFLSDLAADLAALHGLSTHPFDQSVRHGTQTSANLLRSSASTLIGFREAIDGPIRRRMAALGRGVDRVRARNTFAYRIIGMWSVRLRAGGFHANHVHPMGWLSSACYIQTPDGVGDEATRAGWLKFGEPGIAMNSPMPAEHFIRPAPGLLALFPSYMWHGTETFSGDGVRLSIAFDLVPA